MRITEVEMKVGRPRSPADFASINPLEVPLKDHDPNQ